MTTNIESLRTFAEQHGEIEFAHLCTAALAGKRAALRLAAIRATDTTRPDGAIARSVEV